MKKLSLVFVAVSIGIIAWSQKGIPMIGQTAPSFTANTTNGKLEFPEDFGKNWKILFSHPKDFTPVCTSEILGLAAMQDEFKDLGISIAIISVDDVATHAQWKQSLEDMLEKNGGSGKIDYPFIDDANAVISYKYGMLHSWDNITRDVRGVFIIDPDNVIQTINFYPNNIGRNLQEIKRAVIALQTSKEQNVLTPVNWEKGDDVLMPYIPYTEEEYKNSPELQKQYYKAGMNMYFKRGEGKQ
ncbi:MAG: redoxin domain-containing protein [Bacteroidales bacterium]|nr:redoxin domain-containing protein [Bacteroidales bacterium]